MIIKILPADNYRFERKFLVEEFSGQEAEAYVKANPAFFREIYYQRFVNNIYYDTPDFKFFHDNVDGLANRLKVRVRWYGELYGEILKPVLEFKIKSGHVGRKSFFQLEKFNLNKHFYLLHLKNILDTSNIPEDVKQELKGLHPVLVNRYSRKYYLSADGSYRLTIDSDLSFYTINKFEEEVSKKYRPDVTIIELKYAADKEKEAEKISSRFNFRLTKSSKYVDGLNHLTLAKAY